MAQKHIRLKELRRMVEKLQTELIDAENDFAQAKSHKLDIERRLSNYKEEQKRLNESKHLQVSDHAIVRYMRRVMGVDIEAMKEEILQGNPPHIPAGKYPMTHKTGKQYEIVVRNNVVVTVNV
jgi:chromosome segregation ATPase